MSAPVYPVSRQGDQFDRYHGVEVRDPYRWLEDSASEERAEWIAAQNATTQAYLSGVSWRPELRMRFNQLLRYTRYYDLVRRGPYLFFKRNDGLQNQLPLYVQRGLEGTPEVLIDPIVVAPDGTTRITSVAPSKDAKYLAYGLSRGGSDWQEYHVKEVDTRHDMPDTIRWVKLSSIAWRGDGFYYSRYPAPADAAKRRSERNENHQIWYHRVGTLQSADTLVYEDPAHPLRLCFVETTEDERFAFLSLRDLAGGHAGNALWLLRTVGSSVNPVPLVTSFEDEYRVVDSRDDGLVVLTNRHAPNWRLVLMDPASPRERDWKEIVPESEHRLEGVTAVGGKLIATYRVHAVHRLYVLDAAGNTEYEIEMPGIGLAQVSQGLRSDSDVIWTFASFTTPPTIYRHDLTTRTSSVFHGPDVPFRQDDYQTKQVFVSSKDGTRVPMFIVHRKGLVLDGTSPALLCGYGGNGASFGPWFDPFLMALLERGVVYAGACLRGGGEYGETWHHAGWREKKQNVFDDCIAAAEWLQANGYTNRSRCALIGASNGGLLVGAVMVQQPDLFRVALPDVGIMDMLRYQKFTVGANWIAEYGSSDDPAMFPILLAYSPLHNIKAGVRYPATLITTSEHDERVVPAHSFKFAAALQANGAGPNPYLIRIETRSGHGPVSLEKMIDERVDVYAFLLAHLGSTKSGYANPPHDSGPQSAGVGCRQPTDQAYGEAMRAESSLQR